MKNAVIAKVSGNFFASDVFRWAHTKGITQYEKSGKDLDMYVPLKTDLVVFYNLSKDNLYELCLKASDPGMEFLGYTEVESIDSVLEKYGSIRQKAQHDAEKKVLESLSGDLNASFGRYLKAVTL